MSRAMKTWLVMSVGLVSSLIGEGPLFAAEELVLQARSRVVANERHARDQVLVRDLRWKPEETAIVVCDMWDKHWCPTSTARVAEMAPRMNEVLKAARARGVMIIHCPSETMDFYKDTPQRKLAQNAPVVPTAIPLERWNRIDKAKEGELPIDDSDGGCDCDPSPKSFRAWSRQIETLEIAAPDAITDSPEAFYLMKQKGIKNVIVMGVHTNMCVLGRPFSIRQLVRQGQNVVLMRDMTDTMYNPAMAPKVSHFTGNDYVVEHIETHWCPSITSVDFLGGRPFRFKDDTRPRLAIVIGEDEYETHRTLPQFARKFLGKEFCVNYILEGADDKHGFPALAELSQANIALISIRRRLLKPEQLREFQEFINAGKPIVGIRTASHPFCNRDGSKPDGRADWVEFDRDVLGCNYTGHHQNATGEHLTNFAWAVPEKQAHPLLRDVPTGEFVVTSWLYKSLPLEPKTEVVMMGRCGDKLPHEPVAWTFQRADGGRTFYTSLGHKGDFEVPAFQHLLLNGIRWAAKQQPTPK